MACNIAITDGMGLELYKTMTSYFAGWPEVDESVLEHV